MTPLKPHKILYAALFAAIALVLAAPAGARPILDDSELGDTAVVVAPDPVSAKAPGTPLWEKALLARSRAKYAYYGTGNTVEPAWLKALNARSEAMNAYYGTGNTVEPAWLKALNARSEAMNEYYGSGQTAVRPDDRGTPRPVVAGTVVTGGSTDGTAWGAVSVGALGGFGIALLIGLGGFGLVHSQRRQRTIAH